MPRTSQFQSKVLARPQAKRGGLTAITASARNMRKLPSQELRSAMRADLDWQKLAWNYHDMITEYHYSVSWVGNILSKARLTVLKDGEETTDAIAVDALNALFGGPAGQTEMLRQIGTHFTVAGEGYIIGYDDDGQDEWLVAPACDLTNSDERSNEWKLGAQVFKDPLVIRLWKPHPRKPLSSDCPTRAALPILGEIHGLTQHVQAQIDSRLTSAGVLVVPSEISYGSTPSEAQGTDGDGNAVTKTAQTGIDGFIAELIDVASRAMADRGSAEAMVPIVLQVAGEYVDKIQHLTFWSDFDENSIKLRQEAIRRLALGMDMPPEVLEGTGDMNHWSSWQVEEAAIKSHTEPLLEIVTSSLTKGYLLPLLEDNLEPEEAARYSFGYDDAKMRLRPNRSAEALELNDRGILSWEATLRENGFDPADAMNPKELANWLLRKLALGSPAPEMVEAAAKALGVMLQITSEPTITAPKKEKLGPDREPVAPGKPGETQDPSLKGHPDETPPDTKDAITAALGDSIVMRALERAGNKLRNQFNRKLSGVTAGDTYRYVDIAENELDFLLADSWAICERYARQYKIDADGFQSSLDSYTRGLLLEHREHTPEGLAAHLSGKTLAMA
jgi:hypothetical protein